MQNVEDLGQETEAQVTSVPVPGTIEETFNFCEHRNQNYEHIFQEKDP